MRVIPSAVALSLALAAPPVRAESTATTPVAKDGASASAPIVLNTTISLNLPLTATDQAARKAGEDDTRRDLYQRSVRECDLLLDSIAAGCVITSISVSSQVNSSPGQPDYLYATSTITLEITLK